jgi:carbamoyl-phosphate synthase large subunit
MKNILITGVGGPTPRSFVRAVKLRENSSPKRFRFVGIDCNPLAYGLYDNSLFDKSYVVPRSNSDQYWTVINELIRKENIDAAIVLPEEEVLEWTKNRKRLEYPVLTHLPDHRVAQTLVNKHQMHEQLAGSSLIPKFIKINPLSYNHDLIIEEIGETFWIRSTEGSSGLGSLKIESEEALAEWISINPKVEEFIATEYLPGRNMACKMLYFNGELKRTACAERVNYIMAKVAPSGITGNTSFGRLINEPELVKLSKQALETIVNKLKCELNGIFTVDYKEDNRGFPKITEINVRHVAFTSSMAAGGANIPADTIEAMILGKGGKEMERIDYTYDESMIFLRDVDAEPVVMRESDLLKEEMEPKKSVIN